MPDPYIQVNRVAEQMTDKTMSGIVSAYRETYANIRKELGDLYAKYEKGGILTYAEMAKYNRLTALQDTLKDELTALSQTVGGETTRLVKDVYAESYYRTGYAVEKDVMANLSYGVLDPKVIQGMVENPIAGLTLKETLSNRRAEIITRIKQEVTRGLVAGSSYGEMADGIQTVLENDATKAMRIARTEGHRASEAGKLASYEHAENIGVNITRIWTSTLDERTRDTHASMDGQEAKNKEDFVSPAGGHAPAPGMFGIASEDINCRCALRARVDGVQEDKFRRVRGEDIVPDLTYSEWAERKGIPMKYTPTSYLREEAMRKTAEQSARQIAIRADLVERQITHDLLELSSQTGARMDGLQYRLKTEESLARKLFSEYEANVGTNVQIINSKIGDAVRYTYVLPQNTYVDGMKTIVEALRAKGYKPYDSKFKNYWNTDTYRGINSNFISPDGQLFEVQFHTAGSLQVKMEKSHVIYEKLRVTKDPKLLEMYNQELRDVWTDVNVPNGILDITRAEMGFTP